VDPGEEERRLGVEEDEYQGDEVEADGERPPGLSKRLFAALVGVVLGPARRGGGVADEDGDDEEPYPEREADEKVGGESDVRLRSVHPNLRKSRNARGSEQALPEDQRIEKAGCLPVRASRRRKP